ncbi:DUF4270 family protein [Rhodohalobacter sp. 8-1]|uniref:DUF4270 family protein n=1 Tax=Rhodohalobacter sp. 8-1 TaxID=3131972 RepID=UPI0030EBDE55
MCSRIKKGSRSAITAFMVLALFLSISSCENEGIVGGELTDGEERVATTTYAVDGLSIVSDNGFSGQLAYSAMGIVNDPVYGTVTSSSLLKPSITQAEIDSFSDTYSLNIVLQFNPRGYGDTTSTSQYNIYEIDERWRGREIQYNNPVAIDESTLIGSFQVSDEDSLKVPVSASFTERFREFFNDSTAMRDSLYRFQFPGLAIVPAEQNTKIDFLRHQRAVDDTSSTPVTRFIVENAQDSLVATLPVLDHGNSMSRTNIPDNTDGFVLHNTMENILRVDFDFESEQFAGKEIVNAQLVFNVDPGPQNTAPMGFTRLENNFLRGHTFETDPLSLHSEIFVRQATVGATLDEDDDVYRITITQYLIDQIYGQSDSTPLYITNQANNGLYVSTKLLGTDAPENVRPRLIITTINPDN